jgi:hypothetical protein
VQVADQAGLVLQPAIHKTAFICALPRAAGVLLNIKPSTRRYVSSAYYAEATRLTRRAAAHLERCRWSHLFRRWLRRPQALMAAGCA